MRLGLITGGYPPDLDGIGDYTWWVAQTLSTLVQVESPVQVFTSAATERAGAAGTKVTQFFDLRRPTSFGQLLTIPAVQSLDWLVLQYNPFSFGARGYCPWVPRTLRHIKRAERPRLAVMFHETCVPKWPWRYAVMFSWQWPIFRAVCRAADVAFVATTRWTPQVRRAAPKLPVHHLPVGSNIPRCNLSKNDARKVLGIKENALVLGLFGAAHVSRRLDWVAETLRQARNLQLASQTILLYVGADGNVIRSACGERDVLDAGRLEAGEVGLGLRAMDVMVSPFEDGVSTRRGSVMAALQHGLPVATTRAKWTDYSLLSAPSTALLLSTATSAGAFAKEALTWISQLPREASSLSGISAQFYERHFGWDQTSRQMLAVLGAEMQSI